ncbi:hypothetical protein P3X46_015533 [Hevea brasiliensis]|uniref:Pentacotripeptide-repeat region of PRORP domain-containing protein n=1 Tax=Hevea brasiliensis TaxID=3981 RepID=A0ABQ9LW85_HEVBR|nr:hypothetical protein P3X46_015533 [Hevea brasiliensis]
MMASGIRPDVHIYNCFISGLCKDGKTTKAVDLFKLMLERGEEPSIVTYNVLISGLCKEGLVGDACKIFEMMLEKRKKPDVDGKYIEPDVITFSCPIQGLCKEDQLDEAAEIYNMKIERGISAFDRMISSGFKPSIHVYDSLLKGCSSQDEAKEIINFSLGADVVKLLQTFASEISEGTSISCNELLMKIQESVPHDPL